MRLNGILMKCDGFVTDSNTIVGIKLNGIRREHPTTLMHHLTGIFI